MSSTASLQHPGGPFGLAAIEMLTIFADAFTVAANRLWGIRWADSVKDFLETPKINLYLYSQAFLNLL